MTPPLTQSTTLVFDVLGLTPAQRTDYYRTLSVDQFTGLLACARRDLGTPYGLWQDDPVGFMQQILGEFLLRKQKEIITSVEANVRTVSPASHEVGKGLAVDTPIPTPAGWTTMGELTAGDLVLGHDGRAVTVLEAHPVRWLRCFRVAFDDRSSIVCDEEHLWTTLDLRARGRVKQRLARRGIPRSWGNHWHEAETRTIGEIAGSLRHHGQLNHVVPLAGPIDGAEVALPLDPYVLGLWLGDGNTGAARITAADPIVAEYVEQAGYPVRWSYPSDRTPAFAFGVPGDGRRLLRSTGVLNDKHIPISYLRASRQQRRAVLAGLLDSDGSVARNGVEVTLTCEHLVQDVYDLILGLGHKAYMTESRATLNGRDCGPRWRIHFTPSEQVFRLPRKADRLSFTANQSGRTARTITAVEEVPSQPTRCIAVDDKHGLFLAGRSLIPTHNTYGAALICAWFACVHPPLDTQIITTAPRMRQVKTLLWPHIHRVHAAAGLPGDVDLVQWKMPGRKSPVAYGFAAPDYDEDAVQGIHAEHLLVIIDEAGGISHTLGKALESITGGAHTRVLAIGNPPTDNEGSWFEERTKSELWTTVRIGWEDTPNYVKRNAVGVIVEQSDEVVPEKIARNLVGEQWVKDQFVEFGEESNFVEARVYARFPKGSTNKTIPWAWIEAAMENDDPEPSTWIRLGVDPASDGGDELAIARAVGNVVTMVHASSGAQNANPTDVAGKALEQIREADQIRRRLGEERPVRVKVDPIGVGWAVAGLLRAWGQEGVHGAEIVDCNVAENANDQKKFSNRRAEMWWAGREMIRPRSADAERDLPARPPVVRLDLERDKRCAAQLNAPKYGHDSQGRIKIEKKVDVKSRLGGSPDRAEAVLLAIYEPRGPMKARAFGSQIADAHL